MTFWLKAQYKSVISLPLQNRRLRSFGQTTKALVYTWFQMFNENLCELLSLFMWSFSSCAVKVFTAEKKKTKNYRIHFNFELIYRLYTSPTCKMQNYRFAWNKIRQTQKKKKWQKEKVEKKRNSIDWKSVNGNIVWLSSKKKLKNFP